MDELYSFGPNYYSSSSSSSSSSSMTLPQVEHLPLTEYYSRFEPLSAVVSTTTTTSTPARRSEDPMPYYYAGSNSSAVSDCANSVAVEGEVQKAEVLGGVTINDKIASHPLYPNLLQAYIDCQKVGAPPQVAYVLDEIRRENDLIGSRMMGSSCMGVDPELDVFMETYCKILLKYKSDLKKPFDEAITFLNSMETELNTIANTNDAAAGNSSDDEEFSRGEIDVQDSSDHQQTHEGHELKDKLFRRYSGYISTLKHEFSKKKKKGKLPQDSKQILTDWWNLHYKWPYPTEVDKLTLAQVTGLDQKQINNWFINQRKRHWKPSETMQFAVMESIYGPQTLSKDR